MAAPSVRSSTWRVLGTSLFLLLVLLQMFIIQVFYAGVFIQSNEVVISPFHFYAQSYDENHRSSHTGFYSERQMIPGQLLVIPCLYVPVVLVAFALLAMLLAAYAKDRATLRFSLVCQALSSSMSLTGLILFLLFNLPYLSRKDMTPCFYLYVGLPVELAITTLLTASVSKQTLPPGWE